MTNREIIEFLSTHPVARNYIIGELLRNETVTIAQIVALREKMLLEKIGSQKEEIANGYALVLRYKAGFNKKTLDSDAERYLEESSYTGLGHYKKENI